MVNSPAPGNRYRPSTKPEWKASGDGSGAGVGLPATTCRDESWRADV